MRGVTAELLRKEGMSTTVMDRLAPEFASFPYSPKGNRSYYGQPVKSPQSIQKAYNDALKIKKEQERRGDYGAPDLSGVTRGDTSQAAARLLKDFPQIKSRANSQQIYASGLGFWMKKNFPVPGEPGRRGRGDYGDPAGGDKIGRAHV